MNCQIISISARFLQERKPLQILVTNGKFAICNRNNVRQTTNTDPGCVKDWCYQEDNHIIIFKRINDGYEVEEVPLLSGGGEKGRRMLS